jgi:predicted metalloprotease
MKWENLRESSNVEDMRSRSFSRGVSGGGSLRLLIPIVRFLLGSKIGRKILGFGAVVGVVAYFMGFNPLALLNTQSLTQPTQTQRVSKNDDKEARFVSAVLAQTEDVWRAIFKKHGMRYKEPKLVLFRGGVNSGCGYASSQTGPFYCSADEKVYLDLGFFDELSRNYNASGDFAQAYVIAHEIGHHVQGLLGTLDKSHRLKSRASKKQANAIQVKIELQADCYAGVWAHYLKGILEDGDIDEALNAAHSIGDDTLQKKAQGYVVPDAFTHGSSASRMKWFKNGYVGGKLESCRTGI